MIFLQVHAIGRAFQINPFAYFQIVFTVFSSALIVRTVFFRQLLKAFSLSNIGENTRASDISRGHGPAKSREIRQKYFEIHVGKTYLILILAIRPEITPENPAKNCFFFREISEALKHCQGCVLAEPSDPLAPNFSPGRLENLTFFIQIICQAP